MRRLITMTALAGALLLTSATAQYGYPYYPDPSMPYGYPMGVPGAMPWGFGVDPLAQMDVLGQQIEEQMRQLEQELAQFDQQMNEEMARINQYFIDLYRKTTGDLTSPDQYAWQKGREIHCKLYPVDCQLAAQNAQASAAALAAQNAAFQERMRQQGAANDAALGAWWDDQAAKDAAHDAWLDGVILGVDDYQSGAGGPTYQLPFAPSQGTWYTSPVGLPLVFDAANNIWYEIQADGSYKPFQQVP